MNAKNAQRILSSLVQGVDPISGRELTNESVIQNAEVLRALMAGISALETAEARAKRRAQLPINVGKEWSLDEEQKLRTEFRKAVSIADIANAHGRTIRAIENRLELLGLMAPTASSADVTKD